MKLTAKQCSKQLLIVLLTLIVAWVFIAEGSPADAKSKIRLNKKKVTVAVGKKVRLKVKGTKKKVKWKSTNKKIAKVSKKGVVKGLKPGACTIKAKVKKKTLKCKITVQKQRVINARKLRNYILKKGKKQSDGSYVITYKKVISKESGAVRTASVKAKKNTNLLKFNYKYDCNEPPGYYTVTMNFNLIRKTKGTFAIEDCDGYTTDTAEARGNISLAYTKAGGGLTFSKLESSPGSDDKPVYTNAQIKEIARGDMKFAFAAWNILAKRAKVSMKSIGFSKYK
jgi:hypothetical protein